MRVKLTVTAMALTAILCSSYSEVNLEWQIDISGQIEAYPEYFPLQFVKQYSDGGVAILLSASIATTNALYVFNSEGVLILEDVFYNSDGPVGNLLLPPNPDYLFVEIRQGGTQESFRRIYEIQGGGFSVTNSPLASKFSSGAYLSKDPSVYFTFDAVTKILSKYRMSPAPSTIEASVASGINGSNYILNWNSKTGESYQIQSSTNLTSWVDVGGAITGTGSPLTWANALTNSKSFYRVITN